MYAECSRFHPYQFIFGGVIDERVNTAKTRHKVNPIFGRISNRIKRQACACARVSERYCLRAINIHCSVISCSLLVACRQSYIVIMSVLMITDETAKFTHVSSIIYTFPLNERHCRNKPDHELQLCVESTSLYYWRA